MRSQVTHKEKTNEKTTPSSDVAEEKQFFLTQVDKKLETEEPKLEKKKDDGKNATKL